MFHQPNRFPLIPFLLRLLEQTKSGNKNYWACPMVLSKINYYPYNISVIGCLFTSSKYRWNKPNFLTYKNDHLDHGVIQASSSFTTSRPCLVLATTRLSHGIGIQIHKFRRLNGEDIDPAGRRRLVLRLDLFVCLFCSGGLEGWEGVILICRCL